MKNWTATIKDTGRTFTFVATCYMAALNYMDRRGYIYDTYTLENK